VLHRPLVRSELALTALLVLTCCATARQEAGAPALAASETTQPEATALETQVDTAALFKNGYAFVRRTATVPAGTSRIHIDALPVPTHGTFWMAADPERLTLGQATVRQSRREEPARARNVLELLRANVGRQVTLYLDDTFVRGRLRSIAEPETGDSPAPRSSYLPVPPRTADLVILEAGEDEIALSAHAVQRVVGPDLTDEYLRSREAVAMTVDVDARVDAELTLLYLERGLTWVPSYAIDLSDAEHATLTAKAELLNEVEDFEDARLELVTGYPNLRFSHIVDPIAMQGDLDAFLASLGSFGGGGGPESALMTQRVMSNAMSSADAFAFPTAGAPGGGESVGDLFFYELEGVDLARGERGLFQLFSLRVPYEHLYEWAIADTINVRRNGPTEQEIWHSVRLTNASSLPWTTAPAMTLEGGRLLGQDILDYTAAGSVSTVRITRAVDVAGEEAEYEENRDRNAGSFHGRAYDRVTVRGELQATNYKNESVRLEITKRVQGEMVDNPDAAEVVTTAGGLVEVNPQLTLTWNEEIGAGETRTLSYRYALYVRP